MKVNLRKTIVASATLYIGLLVMVATLYAQMSVTPTLYVNPPLIEDPSILPNSTITVRIMVDTVSNMKKCDFNLTFNPNVLLVQRITGLPVQGQYPTRNMLVDDDAGFIWINMTYTPAVNVSSPTGLVEIQFFVKDFGSSPLHFESSNMTDTDGLPISHQTTDGFVHIFVRNIAVEDISLPTNETYVGRVIPVNVTVLNDGDMTENFTVSLYYDSTLIATQNVTILIPHQHTSIVFNWNTTLVAPSATPYNMKAIASTVPNESNLTDNTLIRGTIKLKIVGDVNGDGSVNIDDLIAWDHAYGTQFGETNWNEQADVDGNGLVNEDDATLILQHYRETL